MSDEKTDAEGNIPMDVTAFDHVDENGNCLRCGKYVDSYLVRNFSNYPHDCTEDVSEDFAR